MPYTYGTHYRGVAQLIARAVWDREVEGLSPFTPTIRKYPASLMALDIFLSLGTPSNLLS